MKSYGPIQYTIHLHDPKSSHTRLQAVSGLKVSKYFAARSVRNGKHVEYLLDHIGTGYLFFDCTFASLEDAEEFAKGIEGTKGLKIASANPEEIRGSFPEKVVTAIKKIQATRSNGLTIDDVKRISRG